MRYEVLAAVNITNAVFLGVKPCSLAASYNGYCSLNELEMSENRVLRQLFGSKIK